VPGARCGHTLHAALDHCLAPAQDVKDNHEEAAKVAPQTLRLCELVSRSSSSSTGVASGVAVSSQYS
jgi:hypothetical protein